MLSVEAIKNMLHISFRDRGKDYNYFERKTRNLENYYDK